MNYNMQGMNKTIPELFVMLKAAEVEIKKEHQVLMVNKTTSFKKNGKGKKKGNLKKQQASCCAGEETQVWTLAWDWVLLLQTDWSLEAELPQVFGG